MEFLYMLGIVMGTIGFAFTPQFFKLDRDFLKKAIKFILVITVAKLAIMYFINDKEQTLQTLRRLPLSGVFWAWWEDMAFTLPALWLTLLNKPTDGIIKKALLAVPVCALAAIFGIGHSYQGNLAIFAAAAAYLFVFRKVSLKYGIVTMVAIHIFYDMSIYLSLLGAALLG